MSRASSAPPGGGYLQRLKGALEGLSSAESAAVSAVAELLAERVRGGGVVHTFGCGHSALVAAEVSYRAGGLASVNFLGVLPGSAGWVSATDAETDPAPAARLVEQGGVESRDAVVLVSHSGAGPLALAVAGEAAARGAATVALSAAAHTPLARATTLGLATGAPADDCALHAGSAAYGSLSSVLAMALLNAVLAETITDLLAAGWRPPILKSIHADGGRARNASILAHLAPRIPCWQRIASVSREGA